MKFSTTNKLLSLLLNVSIGIFGAWLFLNPSSGVSIFRFYSGIILLIASASMFYVYNKDENKEIMKVTQAIIFGTLGIVFLLSSSFASIVLGVALTAWMLFESFVNIRLSIIYKKLDFRYWWTILLYGLGALGLGVYMLFNLSLSGNTLVMIVGLFTLVRSVFEVVDTLLYKEKYYQITIDKH